MNESRVLGIDFPIDIIDWEGEGGDVGGKGCWGGGEPFHRRIIDPGEHDNTAQFTLRLFKSLCFRVELTVKTTVKYGGYGDQAWFSCPCHVCANYKLHTRNERIWD